VNRDERIAQLQDRLGSLPDRTERLWAKNKFQLFPVRRAPTDLLILNPTNRRFTAERIDVESQLQRQLDPLANPSDEKSVISLLLDRDPHVEGDRVVGKQSKATEALLADWEKRQQEHPLWIRPDGFVSNGNRRLALLKRLSEERGTEGYDWVEVVVFSYEDFTDDDLFEMEAREQLTEGLKMRYSDLNALLTLRDAAEKLGIDWHDEESMSEIASRLQYLVRRSNAAYARIQLDGIKYMSEYLAHIGEPGNYPKMRRSVERFRDVGKNIAWVAREDPSRQADMLEACFGLISAGGRHGDVRGLRTMLAKDPDTFDALLAEMRVIEDEAPPQDQEDEEEIDDEAIDEEPFEDEDDDDDSADSGPSPAPRYPKRQVKRAIDLRLDRQRNKHRQDIEFQVRSSADRLADVQVKELAEFLAEQPNDALRGAVDAIAEWAESARAALEPGK
jgi:hypothetical protein